MEEHGLVRRAQETTAVDDGRVPFDDGLEQRGEVAGVIFQVGILHDHDIAGGFLDSRAHGRALPHVALVQVDGDPRAEGQRGQQLTCTVPGTVIDDDDLLLDDDLDKAVRGRPELANQACPCRQARAARAIRGLASPIARIEAALATGCLGNALGRGPLRGKGSQRSRCLPITDTQP